LKINSISPQLLKVIPILLVGFLVRNDDAQLALAHFGFMFLLAVVVFG